MKTIIAKFRRVTKYGVSAFLAVASCFSASAVYIDLSNCTWTYGSQNGVSGWFVNCPYTSVSIDIEGDIFVPDDGTGGSGVCTNCTKMTPAECAQIKDYVIGECAFLSQQISPIETAVGNTVGELMDSLAEVRRLKDEGDSFTFFDQNRPPSSDQLNSSPQNLYFYNGESYEDYSAVDKRVIKQYSHNSIYNYYNVAVAPVLNDLETMLSNESRALNDASNTLRDLSSSASSIASIASNMDCGACEGSVSGGGGGGSTPSTPSSGCPCEAAITAVKTAVDNCHTKLTDIKTRLDGWDQKIKNINDYLLSIKGDVESIRQTTDRMEDYFRDDTEINFKKLIEHTLKLSNAVFNAEIKLPPNLYWTDYTNATKFTDDSGSAFDWLQKGKTIETETNGAVIDFGEYGSLNWFQRIEFLLGHIAGIFSPTNSTNADFDDIDKEGKIDDAQNVFDTLTLGDEKSVIRQMVSYVEEAESSLNPFHGIFESSSASIRFITFLPDVSVENDLLGNTMPTITMDLTESGNGSLSISNLVELAHNLTNFLWNVFFLIIDILAIIKFVQCLIALNRWYWKIYNSWVSTMFSGGGR